MEIFSVNSVNFSGGEEEFDPSAPRIEDVAREIFKDVPDEEWENLPHDLTDRLDYYLYGAEDDDAEDE